MKEDEPYFQAVMEMVRRGKESGLGEHLESGSAGRPHKVIHAPTSKRFFVFESLLGLLWDFLFWMRNRTVVQLMPEYGICEIHDARWERIVEEVLADREEIRGSLLLVRKYLH